MFEAAATVVAAWILWTALSAVIDEKMPPPESPGDEDEIPGSASRLDILLPLLRNTLLIGLAVVAISVALTTLGLDIGPLPCRARRRRHRYRLWRAEPGARCDLGHLLSDGGRLPGW
jgi:hypothetical protein